MHLSSTLLFISAAILSTLSLVTARPMTCNDATRDLVLRGTLDPSACCSYGVCIGDVNVQERNIIISREYRGGAQREGGGSGYRKPGRRLFSRIITHMVVLGLGWVFMAMKYFGYKVSTRYRQANNGVLKTGLRSGFYTRKYSTKVCRVKLWTYGGVAPILIKDASSSINDVGE
ncbi:hypothetical protein EYC80_003816 [Monilinia laxa]|uniref:Uncharacterized protein n=1 Tax=Monilinia laxa TaxID=61186 RepID=A0A5N6KKU7_MONLA|nr:hypothetical protein EYC80_003816 [Monilinia laxa]